MNREVSKETREMVEGMLHSMVSYGLCEFKNNEPEMLDLEPERIRGIIAAEIVDFMLYECALSARATYDPEMIEKLQFTFERVKNVKTKFFYKYTHPDAILREEVLDAMYRDSAAA